MKKQIILYCMILLCGGNCIRAMEKEEIVVPQDGIFYLLQLPVDILNYIMQWVSYELLEQFYERVKTVNKVPDEYYQLLPRHSRCLSAQIFQGIEEVMGVFNPDESKIALFELMCGACKPPRLMIIERAKNKGEDTILYNKTLDITDYCSLGISLSGKEIAVIKKEEITGENCYVHKYQDWLVIKKMDEENKEFAEVKRFEIVNCRPQALIFNKQTTHIMMCYQDKDEVEKNMIFSLKNGLLQENLMLEKPVPKENDNLLLHYFHNNCVCKGIIKDISDQ